MAIKYGKKKQRQTNVLYTIVTAILICTIFLSLISYFYNEAENEANEMLHIQTKQIKDDLILQLKSDRENLDTMANFAAKLHVDGESYNILFDSFKPIGLFSAVGILNPDNTFVTKIGSIDLSDKISYEDEVLKGKYISGRIPDLTRNGKEIVRSAVPIVSDGKTVGILYGVIQLETISKKYNQMAQELDAQLFVYDRETGKFIIDTINENPSELSQLKTRKYNDDYSYEKLINSDKGYTSFKSIKTGEDLYIHYSTLEDFEWGIMLARYETQVFEKTHNISKTLFTTFALMMFVIVIYSLIIFKNERRRSVASLYVSSIRKLLLEINQHENNVFEALKHICEISFSRSSFFIDTDGEDFNYIRPDFKNSLLFGKDKNYFISELFQYARTLHSINHSTLGFMCIKPNNHLRKTNKALYEFLKEHKINEISLAAINGKDNQTSILGVTNAKKNRIIRMLLEDVAVCFSIAIFNKNHLNRTETAATTDSLTGALNRVSYKKDILVFDEEKPTEFSCIYIDVNELHLMNNKYGHAAGDEMLKYIANSLKEVFLGHRIYRMGGDEFLVFAKNTKQEQIKSNIEFFIEQLKKTNYKVAIGMSYRNQNTNCEELVREAEIRMYEAKAQYYQNKQQNIVIKDADKKYIYTKTGIEEIDTILSVLNEHYNGIYRVSLKNNSAHRILMPSYLGYREDENDFSTLFKKYVEEIVHPDFHRPVTNFLNYDAIKRQLEEGLTPKITYKKTNGETVTLNVYSMESNTENVDETLWVFANM